jgi:RNA polymerase sigma factor (sigma-70 family)
MVRTIADWHKEYFPMVFRRCKFMLRKSTYAPEDAAQDVFVNLLTCKEKAGYIAKIKNVESLLWTIATNVCLNKLKARKWKPGEDLTINEEEIYPASGDDYKRVDDILLLEAILEEESEEVRHYVYMHYYDGMGYVEIANTVGKSKTWVGKKLASFRERARKELEESVK